MAFTFYCCLFIFPALLSSTYGEATTGNDLELLVVTVATDETDGFLRFKKSVDYFNLNLLVLGMNEEWKGGDMARGTGGAHKINLLKQGLAEYKDRSNLVLFFTDSYDVVFAAGKDEILSKFKGMDANLVISAEKTLWPDKSLEDQYPEVDFGDRFLCSGGIIGYAPALWKTINVFEVTDTYDDQLYYTKIYIDPTLREEIGIKLDHTSEIVQNINFARHELAVVELEGASPRVQNTYYMTYPCVLHGNGPSKITLNQYSNYVPNGWNSETGCASCKEDLLEVESDEKLPRIQLAIFITQATPFLEEFFQRISTLDYPGEKMDVYISNQVEDADPFVHQFLLRHRSKYNSVVTHGPFEELEDYEARYMAAMKVVADDIDYQLSVDAHVQILTPLLLRQLLSKNKQFVAPLVKKHNKLWSNFWGALNTDGYYARSDDYIPIANYEKMGVWNMPFVNSVYLVKKSVYETLQKKINNNFFFEENLDTDMTFCKNLRNEGIFMFVVNEYTYGRLVSTDGTRQDQVHADMWQISHNPIDWEEKYLHADYYKALDPEYKLEEPCHDVYTVPLLNKLGTQAIIDIMEDNGQWSGSSHEDKRIAGGYENVPTDDIHMNQAGYEAEWLDFLRNYVKPFVEVAYPGYHSKVISSMMFVVRYKPTRQSFLRPHHDASTWTLNLALNDYSDGAYEGGGARFIRYDCKVVNLTRGYGLIHPGRLTHYHEGLQTTAGTRYIAVSFVDP